MWAETVPFDEDKIHNLFVQPARSIPNRLQHRALGDLRNNIENHINTNALEQSYQLLQNGGKLHIIVGLKTYDLFAVRPAAGADKHEVSITENRKHLEHYNTSAEVASSWMAEAQSAVAPR